jgi:hypothetical protein
MGLVGTGAGQEQNSVRLACQKPKDDLRKDYRLMDFAGGVSAGIDACAAGDTFFYEPFAGGRGMLPGMMLISAQLHRLYDFQVYRVMDFPGGGGTLPCTTLVIAALLLYVTAINTWDERAHPALHV